MEDHPRKYLYARGEQEGQEVNAEIAINQEAVGTWNSLPLGTSGRLRRASSELLQPRE